jgi:hypothetical protein
MLDMIDVVYVTPPADAVDRQLFNQRRFIKGGHE